MTTITKTTTTADIMTRNDFGALMPKSHTGTNDGYRRTTPADEPRVVREARKLIALLDGPVDEHGAWQRGIESDRKGRGVAVNVDLYGAAVWRRRVYAVVQVRESTFHPNRHTRTRKDYYLCGRNENGRPFAHSVSWGPVRGAIRANPSDFAAPVLAAMAWIWGCTAEQLSTIARNGDTALIPCGAPRGSLVSLGACSAAVVDSHRLEAAEVVTDGEAVYARDGVLSHGRGQHPTVSVEGWARVAVGRRADTWNFSAPTAD